MTECRLCQQDRPLLQGHVIPRFVTKWLRETSATGFLRGPLRPNLRQQDLPTERLLCAGCEELFSKIEKSFAEKVFFPLQETGRPPSALRHGEWFLRFAVSMAWRAIATDDLVSLRERPELVQVVEAAREDWRRYLVGKTDEPGPYEHHIFFLDVITAARGPIPKGAHAYLLRSVDSTIAAGRSVVGVYTKLPRILFWASVRPPHAEGWENTLIERSGTIRSPQALKDRAFGEFLFDRIQLTIGMMSDLSTRQQHRINDAMMRDPDRVVSSGTFEALMADRAWSDREPPDSEADGVR